MANAEDSSTQEVTATSTCDVSSKVIENDLAHPATDLNNSADEHATTSQMWLWTTGSNFSELDGYFAD